MFQSTVNMNVVYETLADFSSY